jgi:hypothetical protein
METQTDLKTPRKIYAGMLCVVASIILLFRICIFFLLYLFTSRRIIIADGSRLFALSMAVFGFSVPLFGLLAIRDILTNWLYVTNPDYLSINKSLVRRIAYSFLITGLFFAIVTFLLEIFIISHSFLQADFLPALPSIWLIIMALMALVMSYISYRLFTKTSVRLLPRAGAIFGILIAFIAGVAVFLPVLPSF